MIPDSFDYGIKLMGFELDNHLRLMADFKMFELVQRALGLSGSALSTGRNERVGGRTFAGIYPEISKRLSHFQGMGFIPIHDLGALIAEAQKYDERFGEFADFADELTDPFWAMHYPGGESPI